MFAIEIRKAIEPDTPQIMEIEKQSFNNPWSLQAIVDELHVPNSINLVAHLTSSRDIIGYIFCRNIADELNIYKVATHSGFRRKGIAERLCLEAMKLGKLNGAEIGLLEVRKSNTAAIGLYEKLGFKHLMVRRKYYSAENEDALVMVKTIDSTLFDNI